MGVSTVHVLKYTQQYTLQLYTTLKHSIDSKMGMCCSTPFFIEKEFKGHTGYVTSVAISSDNTFIISGSEDATIRIWDIESGDCTKILGGQKDRVQSVALSNNNEFIVSGSWDRTVRLWNLKTGGHVADVKTFCGHTSLVVNSVDISPNNNYIVSSGGKDETARIWDRKTGACIRTLDLGETVYSVCFSSVPDHLPDSECIFVSDNRNKRLFDIDTGDCISTIQAGSTCGSALSSDGKYIVGSGKTCIGSVALFNAETSEYIKDLGWHTHFLQTVAITDNNKWIASGGGPGNDQFVRLWNVETGKQTKLGYADPGVSGGHGYDVSSVVFSVDSKYIVSGSCDRTICLWNVETITCKNVVDTRTANPLE